MLRIPGRAASFTLETRELLPSLRNEGTGSFCATCGRSTATAVDSASSVGSEDVDPAPVAMSNWRPQPSAVAPGAVLPRAALGPARVGDTFVMFAFLASGVIGAALVLVEHIAGVGDVSRFP